MFHRSQHAAGAFWPDDLASSKNHKKHTKFQFLWRAPCRRRAQMFISCRKKMHTNRRHQKVRSQPPETKIQPNKVSEVINLSRFLLFSLLPSIPPTAAPACPSEATVGRSFIHDFPSLFFIDSSELIPLYDPRPKQRTCGYHKSCLYPLSSPLLPLRILW